MNSKNIKRHMNAKLRDWLKSIDNEEIRKVIKDNSIVTGGAIVSLLTGDAVNDYDIYFKTKEACIAVAGYYVGKWNVKHKDKPVTLMFGNLLKETTGLDNGSVKCFVRSKGVADESEESTSSIAYDLETEDVQEESGSDAEKYRPRFITSNAITLSDKIQIVTRFFGEVEDIHKNYDFAHCMCAWSSWDNIVFLPVKALECIINKELYYSGSKYPLCSIIRTRKYIERGWHINAGQYVKMCMQLNELNLTDIYTLEEQLTGVDTAYFQSMINQMKSAETGKIDACYVIELVNKLF